MIAAFQCSNRLLSSLSGEDRSPLIPYLRLVRTEGKQVICQRDEPISEVYFPCNSVLSVLTYMEDGTAVEIGTIGSEGFCGIDILIGMPIASETTVCQVAGDNLCMAAADFRKAIAGDTPLRRIAQRFLQAFLAQVSQSVACNRRHTIEERFARWLLMTHDRTGRDQFQLTQEFMAVMLGVHRPSVSLVANEFQQSGLIRYRRGDMTVLDRQGLEKISCECYGVVRKQFDRLLGSGGDPGRRGSFW